MGSKVLESNDTKFYGMGLLISKDKKQKNPQASLKVFRRLCTWDGNRTHTSVTAHGILSPACLPVPPPKRPSKTKSTNGAFSFWAKDGVRTRDLDLGKVALYQLSYFRVLWMQK